MFKVYSKVTNNICCQESCETSIKAKYVSKSLNGWHIFTSNMLHVIPM